MKAEAALRREEKAHLERRRTGRWHILQHAIAAVLVPLLALTPSCAAPRHEVWLRAKDGPPVELIAESGGQPIQIPEAELRESFRHAARVVTVKADPLASAEELFGVAEGSGTYRYDVRAHALVPEALRGLEELEDATRRMTRGYREWCGGTRLGPDDCLHLLAHSRELTLHGRYVVTLVMALKSSFGPMLESLEGLAEPNAVAAMITSAVAMYIVLLVVPEPISKLISLSITGALIGYLGLTMFWELVYGIRAMASAVDAATDFGQLQSAAKDFGKVLGPQMGQLLVLLVCHSLGKGIAGPPRFAEASAQAEQLIRVPLASAAAVRSIALGAGVITITLATGAMAVGVPSGPRMDGDLQKRIREAQRALEKDRDFRRWFHREYKPGRRVSSGVERNPDLTGEDVLDAYEEWTNSGKPQVK